MNILYLVKKEKKKLLIFFTGWATNKNTFKQLTSVNYDVIFVFDYTSITPISSDILDKYSEISIVAWSMGIWAAEKSLISVREKITSSVAINGSPKVIDDFYGIPNFIFENTANNLTEQTLRKFYLRICGSRIIFNQFMKQAPNIPATALKNELLAIKGQYSTKKKSFFEWENAVISINDKIFPLENMKRYWQGKTKLKMIENAHFPFKNVVKWEDLINFAF